MFEPLLLISIFKNCILKKIYLYYCFLDKIVYNNVQGSTCDNPLDNLNRNKTL